MTLSLSTAMMALAQVAFALLFSPLVIGVIRKIKARFQAREGAPIIQPYFDLAKLLMKGSVRSSTSSWITTLSPIVNFAVVIIAAAMLPMFSGEGLFSSANVVFFIYLFAIGRFFMTLGGLDAASAFGGLGSSREMLLSAFIEPALMLLVLFLAVSAGGSADISAMAAHASSSQWQWLQPPQLLAAAAFLMLVFAELKRMPFDNPATHLELTMVHEAMILETSGPELALMEWGNAAKLVVLTSLFGLLFTPVALLWHDPLLAFAALAGLALAVGAFVAAAESVIVKVRLFKVTELLMFALVLGLLAFLSQPYKIEGGHGLLTIYFILAMLVTSIIFVMSATFRRRVRLFWMNSIALALVLLIVAVDSPGFDNYFRLASTVLLKVIIAPIILYVLFRHVVKPEGKAGASGEQRKSAFRRMIDHDPLFSSGQPMLLTLSAVAAIVIMSFAITWAAGLTSLLVPLTISIILTGLFIIAIKQHMLLQMFGLLLLENGIVLLPVALSINIPFLAEAATLLDVIVLITVAFALAIDTRKAFGSFDSSEMDELTER